MWRRSASACTPTAASPRVARQTFPSTRRIRSSAMKWQRQRFCGRGIHKEGRSPMRQPNSMAYRFLVAALVAAAVLAVGGPAVGREAKQDKVYKSPQEAFRAFKEAADRDDFKGVMAVMTDESRD